MHYCLEILMPPTDDVKAAVDKILAPFSENHDEEDGANRGAFWDWYQLGGRYSGSKIEAAVGEEKLSAFRAALMERGVTISGVVWGKEELSPASQIPSVDALWREMCPGAGSVCPLFKHSGDQMPMDVCRLDEVPEKLTAFSFIHAADGFGNALSAQTLLHKTIWNGATHQETTWDGSVKTAIDQAIKQCEHYRDKYKAKVMPQPDWLVVTVDYHS